MGISKTELFTERQNELAAVARLLGHPARIAILEILLETRGCITGDLVAELGLAQATVSQHLKELKDAGLIRGNVEGNRVNYCLNENKWSEMGQLLGHFLARSPKTHSESCC